MSDKLIIEQPSKADIAHGRKFQKSLLGRVFFMGGAAEQKRKREIAAGARSRRRITSVPILGRLDGLLARCKGLNPHGGGQIAAMEGFVQRFKDSLEDEAAQDDFRALVADAHGGDAAARVALGMTIAESVGYLVRSASNWLQWYDVRTLGEDEVPFLHNFVPQQIDVRVGTNDGTLQEKKATTNDWSDDRAELYFLLSDVFTGKLFDIYKGNIRDAQLGTIDIAMDLMEQVDALAQAPIVVGATGSVYTAAFTADGTPASHYHASDRIQTDNFPTGNIVSASGNGAATLPRLAVLTAIHEYYSRFGSGVFEGQDAAPVAVHVAPIHAVAFSSEFDASSHVNRYTENVFQTPFMLEAHGRQFLIVPDNTIPTTDKHVYVRPNLPVGIHLHKPAGDYVHMEELVRDNAFETWERKAIGWLYPVTWMPRTVAIKFRT